MKKPWVYNPKILGFIYGTLIKATRFLNQVPTLPIVSIVVPFFGLTNYILRIL